VFAPNLVPVSTAANAMVSSTLSRNWFKGQTLEQHIAGKPRPFGETALAGPPAGRDLQQVPQHGIIHRNLKPSVIDLTAGALSRQPPATSPDSP